MYTGKMKIRRFNMVNAANGWSYHVVCVDREENGEMVRTWSTDGQRLEVAKFRNYEHLVLPGTNTSFVLPRDDDEGE